MTAITPEPSRQWDWRFFLKGICLLAAATYALVVLTSPDQPFGHWLDDIGAGHVPAGWSSSSGPIEHAPSPWGMQAVLASDRQRALLCLTQAVYYEARGEDLAGQQAVAQVVLNRLSDPKFPKSVCAVVYQGSELNTGCQFTFTCDGSLSHAPSGAAWLRAEEVAQHALAGRVFAGVGAATHYHNEHVAPYWRTSLTELTQVGRHIFYMRPQRATLLSAALQAK
jgi:hypothetical protein